MTRHLGYLQRPAMQMSNEVVRFRAVDPRFVNQHAAVQMAARRAAMFHGMREMGARRMYAGSVHAAPVRMGAMDSMGVPVRAM